jgi:hypothetical protein
MKSSQISRSDRRRIASCGSAVLFVTVAAVLSVLIAPKKADAAPTHSTTIALTSDETVSSSSIARRTVSRSSESRMRTATMSKTN